MNIKGRQTGVCLWIVFTCLFTLTPVFSQEETEKQKVSAKIGIQVRSGNKTFRARPTHNIKAGDFLRIYICAKESYHVYVIHSDRKSVTLLNQSFQQIKADTVCLPSAEAYYKVDGKSPMEKFTVILSPEPLPRLSDPASRNALEGKMSPDEWAKIEADLIKNSRIELAREPRRAMEIAGNVRGTAGASAEGDPFLKDLPIYSGMGILVKAYAFSIHE